MILPGVIWLGLCAASSVTIHFSHPPLQCTVLARNVTRQQGRGNDGAISVLSTPARGAISVLSTPKGGADKAYLKETGAVTGTCCQFNCHSQTQNQISQFSRFHNFDMGRAAYSRPSSLSCVLDILCISVLGDL